MKEQKSMVYLLIRNIILLLLIAFVLGIFIVQDKLAYCAGLSFGGIITILKVFLMENTMKRAVVKPPHAATNYVRAHYYLRLIITFIVLFIGVYTPSIHFVGLVIGLLILKPAAYLQGKLEIPVQKDGSVEFLEWEEEDEDEKSDFW